MMLSFVLRRRTLKRRLLLLWFFVFAVHHVLAQEPAVTPEPRSNEVESVPGHNWQQLTPSVQPPPRYDHALIAANDYNRLILFGGRGADGPLGDTWIYDFARNDWRQVTSPLSPEPRFGMGAAYDSVSKRALIFAGQGNEFFNDVWAFDVEKETWSKLETSGAAPAARYGTSAVLNPTTGQLIISHGFASGRFDDTFALDLKTNVWRELLPENRPLKRCLHEAVFDLSNGKMLLFGGCSSGYGPCPQGDLWSFDPVAKSWTELKMDDAYPAPRSNPSLAADTVGLVWLFGGKTAVGVDNELWSLNPQTTRWMLYTTTNTPSARSSHDAVWDAVNDQLVIFGGKNATGVLNDFWVYQPG
jgi:N-acetylneuraminic acid mutarotase